ncbi:hypothetical protein BJX61DRAFT_540090 [Aspergillus egyptiacus]|nr:hypothetical protein BJX61DRAFT_540090 [Aspergillus egyptiacus]
MKGLHGGIPLAVLAATARAQVRPAGGVGDVGNYGGSFPAYNVKTTNVQQDIKDDHSIELEHEYEVHVYPVHDHGKDYGHGHDYDKRSAEAPEGTALGGPGGIDVGNNADLPTLNTAYEETNVKVKDDHSVDYDEETFIKVPEKEHHWKPEHDWKEGEGEHHWRRDGPTALGGPAGVDVGNNAGLPTLNTAYEETNVKSKDDHSLDVDKTTLIKVPKKDHDWKPEHDWKKGEGEHHWRRDGPTALGGPAGVDVGNNAGLPTLNTAYEETNVKSKDDHSLDVDKTTLIKVPKKDHDWKPEHDWKKGEGEHHWRRDGPTALGGPAGVDIGNNAGLPTVNKFSSQFTGHYQDDHSVDADFDTIIKKPQEEHHWKPDHDWKSEDDGKGDHWRRDGPTALGGPAGVDIGNNADLPTLNSYTSKVDVSHTDSHATDIDSKFFFKGHGHKARAFHPGNDDEERGTAIGGPSGVDIGNNLDIPTVNSAHTETNIESDDDHSKDLHSTTVVAPGDQGHPHHLYSEDDYEQPPTKPIEEHCPEKPRCTKTYEVTETVTSTHLAYVTETVYTHPVVEKPYDHHTAGGCEPGYPSQDEEGYPGYYHGSLATPTPTPATTPVYYHAPSSPAYHIPIVSSYATIPVSVPTHAAHVPGSLVVASTGTPASSTRAVVPTGASPEQNERPSPSSHGPMTFTGGAGRFVPSAGVVSVLAGVLGLFAFAL